ncbi:SAHH, partial [Symbiodinium sp. CCMP2456]
EGHGLGRIRPQGAHLGGARDAWPDGGTQGVWSLAAFQGHEHQRLPAHDHPDGCAHRDLGGAWRQGALVLLQHLQHA